MKFEIASKKRCSIAAISRFDETVGQARELVEVGRRHARARPLQRERFQLHAQRVELANLFGGKLGDVAAFVVHAPHEAFVLERDQGLAHDRRAHVHLSSKLSLDNWIARLELSAEKGVFQRGNHPLGQRNRLDLLENRFSGYFRGVWSIHGRSNIAPFYRRLIDSK